MATKSYQSENALKPEWVSIGTAARILEYSPTQIRRFIDMKVIRTAGGGQGLRGKGKSRLRAKFWDIEHFDLRLEKET